MLAAMFAATIMQVDFASAQQAPYGAVDGRVVPKSAASDWISQTDARKFGSIILALDSSPSAPSRAACDLAKKHTCEGLVQDNILWRIDDPDNAASKHWQQKNLDELCACTTDPYATVNCFQIQVNNNRKSWEEAIATCRAKPWNTVTNAALHLDLEVQTTLVCKMTKIADEIYDGMLIGCAAAT